MSIPHMPEAHGGIALSIGSMRERADLLLGPDTELPAYEELQEWAALLRGDLMRLIPEVEDRTRVLPSGDADRAAAMAGVGEARRRLDAIPAGSSMPKEVIVVQRLARCVIALTTHVQTLLARDSVIPWHPPQGNKVMLLEGGKWWDAVRLTGEHGHQVRAGLGDENGAIIIDDYGTGRLYWLVRPGAAARWDTYPQVEIRGAGSYVGVPPVHWTDAERKLRWLEPLLPARYLTPADALHTAIKDTLR